MVERISTMEFIYIWDIWAVNTVQRQHVYGNQYNTRGSHQESQLCRHTSDVKIHIYICVCNDINNNNKDEK